MAVKGTKNRRAAQIQEMDVLNTVKGMTFDTVTKEMGNFQVELQKALADLSAKLAEQFQMLETVQESIRLKQEELKQLHQIEVTATTLDELQAQIQETKELWDEQQSQWKRDFDEMKTEQKKVWTREQDDYKYTTEQKQRKQEDALAALFAQKEKLNADKQEQLEKTWAEREMLLKKAEQELLELRQLKEQLPDMIKKAENAAQQIAGNSVKKEYEHKTLLLQKDAETEKRLADAQVASLTQQIEKLVAQITDLKQQIDQAHQRVADISTKAFDSVSGRATTEALQRMMETEKVGKTNK